MSPIVSKGVTNRVREVSDNPHVYYIYRCIITQYVSTLVRTTDYVCNITYYICTWVLSAITIKWGLQIDSHFKPDLLLIAFGASLGSYSSPTQQESKILFISEKEETKIMFLPYHDTPDQQLASS